LKTINPRTSFRGAAPAASPESMTTVGNCAERNGGMNCGLAHKRAPE
jgi:hypothetical protein